MKGSYRIVVSNRKVLEASGQQLVDYRGWCGIWAGDGSGYEADKKEKGCCALLAGIF